MENHLYQMSPFALDSSIIKIIIFSVKIAFQLRHSNHIFSTSFSIDVTLISDFTFTQISWVVHLINHSCLQIAQLCIKPKQLLPHCILCPLSLQKTLCSELRTKHMQSRCG